MLESRAHETVQQDQMEVRCHQYHNPGDCPGSDDGDLHRFGKAVTGLAKDDLQRTAEENAAHISKSYEDGVPGNLPAPLESVFQHQTPRIGLM
jgi:hypothetical protein